MRSCRLCAENCGEYGKYWRGLSSMAFRRKCVRPRVAQLSEIIARRAPCAPRILLPVPRLLSSGAVLLRPSERGQFHQAVDFASARREPALLATGATSFFVPRRRY